MMTEEKKIFLKGIGAKIRELRTEKKITQEELARRCGYTSYTSINKIESGLSDIPQFKLQMIADALGTTPGTLFSFVPEKGDNYHTASFEVPQYHKLPVYGMVSAGLGDFADNHIVDYEEASVNYNREEYFYLIVDGDSMEPQIHDGQLALVQKTPTVDSGSVAIVTIDGEEGVIKKVIYDESAVTLISFNDKYPPRVFKDEEKLRLRVQGKVLKTISRW